MADTSDDPIIGTYTHASGTYNFTVERRRLLMNIALSLQNDREFYEEYTATTSSSNALDRRNYIHTATTRLKLIPTQAPSDNSHTFGFCERELVRRYLDDYWNLPAADAHKFADMPKWDLFGDDAPQPVKPPRTEHLIYQIDAALGAIYTLTQPNQGTTMTTPAIIKVETKTFINGSDAKNFTSAQVYDMIAAQEASIEKLDAIQNKPKSLQAEIAERRAGIAALVAHLDAQFDAANPAKDAAGAATV